MDSLSTILREVIMKEKIIKISKKMFIILLVVLSLISLSKFVLFFSPNYIFYHPNEVKIYTKNEKDNLSKAECNELRELVKVLENQLKERE